MEPTTPPLRIAAVDYLNTLPLIDGLDRLAGVAVRRLVPALLADELAAGAADVALCSSIDYQRSAVPLRIVPAGMLGCRGPTLTVRLYSTLPPERLREVHVDRESHTSVALLAILLKERFGAAPRLVPFDARPATPDALPGPGSGAGPSGRAAPPPDALLLIGDKVVAGAASSVRYPHQLDLGATWFEHTGLPFVFAVWMARADADRQRIDDLAAILDHQRRHNVERIDAIVHRRAAECGWPAELARHYLAECLRYDFDAEAEAGLEAFWQKAHEHGLVPRLRPLERFDAVAAG